MHEERLSPELGRLIDAAKAVAVQADPARAGMEVVGVLASSGQVYATLGGEAGSGPVPTAAESAVALARAAEDDEVLTAVVTLAHDGSESVTPSLATCRTLGELDSELPVVIKQRGRWVVLPVSQLKPKA